MLSVSLNNTFFHQTLIPDHWCIRWRLLLYQMETITVSDGDYYCIRWRLLLYQMETITVSDGDYYCIRWRLLLYQMETITVSDGDNYCIRWRLLLYQMETITGTHFTNRMIVPSHHLQVQKHGCNSGRNEKNTGSSAVQHIIKLAHHSLLVVSANLNYK